jgi:hypothetical protein
VFTVEVSPTSPLSLPPGSGTFGGRTCFDIAYSNDKVSGSGPLAQRASLKTNFENRTPQDYAGNAPYSGVQKYYFKPEGKVSYVRFNYQEVYGSSIDSIVPASPNYAISTDIETECELLVYYKTSLHTDLRGKTYHNNGAGTGNGVTLYATYNSMNDGSGEERTVPLNVKMQDAMCCGAKTTYKGWINFSCYNLGADDTLDPFTWDNSAGNNNTTDNGKPDVMDGQYKDIKGWLFQYGRQADGGQARNSAVGTSGWPTIAQYNANPTSYGKLYKQAPGTNYDWVTDPTSAAAQSRWGRDTSSDINLNKPKHATDPCPPGWKIPVMWHFAYIMAGTSFNIGTSYTLAQATANTVTFANGLKIGNTLFLPAGGWRSGHFTNQNVNQNGEHCHYHTTSALVSASYNSNLTDTFVLVNTGWIYNDTNGMDVGNHIRCVSE